MASRRFDALQVLGFLRCAIRGRFFTNGASSPVAASNLGRGYTVTRTGVGTYAVVFTDVFAALEDIHVSVQANSGWANVVIGAWVPSTRTLTLTTYTETAGTIAAADIAANGNNSVSFMAVFRNTSLTT